jgi:GT2 family glycosyltransferase
LIFFIDADVVVEPDWAAALAQCWTQSDVGVAGTRILPRWYTHPLFIARSRIVREQYSILDLGTEQRPAERVVGASFGIHRGRLGPDAYFDERLGRREGVLYAGEESDLCRRARKRDLKVVYEGGVVAYHQILPARISYPWVMRRFFYAGVTRAQLGGAPHPSGAMGMWDYLVLPFLLPSYMAGYRYGKRLGSV